MEVQCAALGFDVVATSSAYSQTKRHLDQREGMFCELTSYEYQDLIKGSHCLSDGTRTQRMPLRPLSRTHEAASSLERSSSTADGLRFSVHAATCMMNLQTEVPIVSTCTISSRSTCRRAVIALHGPSPQISRRDIFPLIPAVLCRYLPWQL